MNLFGKKRIFMDYAGGEGNPSGIHKEGVEAKRKLEDARRRVARILECQARDVVFTSGGTESDNLAVLGVFETVKEKFKRPHIIISDGEHPAVTESAKEAERRGAELSILPVEKILSHIKECTVLVSVMYANNETGAINNVPKLARLIRDIRRKSESRYPLFHTDATSAYELLAVDINKVSADLITLDQVLVVRSSAEIRPIIFGGGQERGLRSGTENVRAIEDFVKHLETALESRESEAMRLAGLKRVFLEEVSKINGIEINTPENSLPNIVSITLPDKLHEFLAIKLDEKGVAVSTGSSCDSSKSEPDKKALRFSFGRDTSARDVREAIRILKEIMI